MVLLGLVGRLSPAMPPYSLSKLNEVAGNSIGPEKMMKLSDNAPKTGDDANEQISQGVDTPSMKM